MFMPENENIENKSVMSNIHKSHYEASKIAI
jgi:hypothetical protein